MDTYVIYYSYQPEKKRSKIVYFTLHLMFTFFMALNVYVIVVVCTSSLSMVVHGYSHTYTHPYIHTEERAHDLQDLGYVLSRPLSCKSPTALTDIYTYPFYRLPHLCRSSQKSVRLNSCVRGNRYLCYGRFIGWHPLNPTL